MEFDEKKLKEWWDKISPEDQNRIMSKNNFPFKEKSNSIINYETVSEPKTSVTTTTHTLITSDRYK
jgi:hypothetical protein